ncbi:PREDICTED: probable polygalacturonase At2g43860 [Erythranthe guttata]|uniref:probable polygalacturonase At2g43860 n=1 Tax=Erythranthe guttata TaxID=4155 RepID=UPI00064D7620|nr:PREDICTED: probable polygalacturonase At2g43860 [Erythranthe guttata]|eukprot:XP_012829369.1 PREDICTED: probable polygalacturonase At2g43860 [Erythranthe guttata]
MSNVIPLSCKLFIVVIAIKLCTSAAHNVVDFGARGDGKTDSTSSFLKAWNAACNSDVPTASMVVPNGTFLVKSVTFTGPCKSDIKLLIHGTLIAPNNYRFLGSNESWIMFYSVSRLSIVGGTLNAKGSSLWSCKSVGNHCPFGARVRWSFHISHFIVYVFIFFKITVNTPYRNLILACNDFLQSLSFQSCNKVLVSGLKSFNSQRVHISINGCSNMILQRMKIIAPSRSPNTDGIHIGSSRNITITNSNIGTGDDCISIGQGSMKMRIDRIVCGPGHGIRYVYMVTTCMYTLRYAIYTQKYYDNYFNDLDLFCFEKNSIGSLGSSAIENGVDGVIVTNSIFTQTQNGVRVKSWPKASDGYAKNLVFKNLTMRNVANPIIIDQDYCPTKSCTNSKVTYITYSITLRNLFRQVSIKSNGIKHVLTTTYDKLTERTKTVKLLKHEGPNALYFNYCMQNSGVKVSQVRFEQIKGTSLTQKAITLRCSSTNPCQGIELKDIDLTYVNHNFKKPTLSDCENARGFCTGFVYPKNCL